MEESKQMKQNKTEQNRTKQPNKIRENTYEWLKWELKYYIKKTLKLCWRTEKEGLMIWYPKSNNSTWNVL